VKQTRALKPDVVLMDLVMPGIGGLEAVRRIAALHVGTKILVLRAISKRIGCWTCSRGRQRLREQGSPAENSTRRSATRRAERKSSSTPSAVHQGNWCDAPEAAACEGHRPLVKPASVWIARVRFSAGLPLFTKPLAPPRARPAAYHSWKIAAARESSCRRGGGDAAHGLETPDARHDEIHQLRRLASGPGSASPPPPRSPPRPHTQVGLRDRATRAGRRGPPSGRQRAGCDRFAQAPAPHRRVRLTVLRILGAGCCGWRLAQDTRHRSVCRKAAGARGPTSRDSGHSAVRDVETRTHQTSVCFFL